ncbi:hypothetical protein B0A54_07025 [Friedmanniomyces endolithicus]|uniref:FHA domain-containing protein n=1 Tax=Friedmanniomyces endolithicus TaxID=329885 RepID=A0A4V5NA86_9PEZI|nr:hypothetical protein LTS09_007157 [Friedmanniomyces endolithicus]KAK0315611.1 hypothetical protein LTR01_000911 [Friedmanniomyces endolithicus]KAK0835970.1 hypothetical protein LTR73_000471 [Friedmanniomyces endolithicus]TKA42809.1 hypothetical protein B0A54_07025 [Friedmanniomyces endolithicus]
MWLLSSDGDILDGKRHWLRPGSTHLQGRSTGRIYGKKVRYIDDKSVSRQHFIITVGEVEDGDATKLHKRPTIILHDNSKTGTNLDGERFNKSSRTPEGKTITYRLGHYAQTFSITWQPVVLTMVNLGKKGKDDALEAQKQQFAGTDVKLLTEYVSNETTHVVAKKRNIAVVLQGLVQGRRVVGYDWVDALAAAAKQEGRDAFGDLNESLLELDFDANWPNEEERCPPTGSEPVPRPPDYLKPNADRIAVFTDSIFIFLSQSKYDDLIPVITSGGGKALLWEVSLGESSGDDLVTYVKEVAGKKDDAQFQLSQQTGRGGVFLVRLGEVDGWTTSFMQSVDKELGQQSIMLNEFLDVILTADTSGLRRPVMRGERSEQHAADQVAALPLPSAPPQNQRMNDAVEQPQVAEQVHVRAQGAAKEQSPERAAEEPTTAPKEWNRRTVTKSRFQGFDDFDTSQFAKAPSASPEPSQAPSVEAMDVDPSQPGQTQQSTRKRPAPTQEADEPEDPYDALLTGQAALKRRKTEAARKGENSSFAKSFGDSDRTTTKKAARSKKKEQQLDVKAALAERREAEEERRRKDEDALREQLAGVDLADLHDLAQIEEMEIPVRKHPPPRRTEPGAPSARWDPAWNGRKNFKRFRPHGLPRDGPRARQVIVQLEEVTQTTNGLGAEYWLDNNSGVISAGGRSSVGKSKSQSQSQTTRSGPTQLGASAGEADEAELRFRRRVQQSREEDAEDANEMANVGAGRARDDDFRALAEQSQTLGTESQRKAAGKRPASGQAGGGGGPPAKKARQGVSAPPQEDDEDDGLKFRRRRRG